MTRHKKWFFTGLIIIAVELGSVGLINYIVDPYGFFRYGTWRHDVSHQFIAPSENFIKTRYIALNPQKYDCLIFGSSRANGIDGRQVKDATCYNMQYGAGLPRNHLDNLRYIVKKGARPRIVLIGLDEFSYKYRSCGALHGLCEAPLSPGGAGEYGPLLSEIPYVVL